MKPEPHELREVADDLKRRWEQLDIRRFTGRTVGLAAPNRPTRSHLAEYQALQELDEASTNRVRRPSLVRNAIALLDVAYSQAADVDIIAKRRVAGRRLAECLRAYRTLSTGTVPLSSLNIAAKEAWEVCQVTPSEDGDGTLLLRCSLGEFFKEAYTSETVRAVITPSEFDIFTTDENLDHLLLERAFQILDPIKDLLTSGELLERHDLITAAAAIRHLAVVHEYHYFRSDCPKALKAGHLHNWLRLSVDAAAVCVDQEEFNTQAYSLLNKAAALAELTASDVLTSQFQTLVESAGDIQSAQDLFALTADDRGVAWSGIHLARIYARQYEISQKNATGDELKDILRKMLETAIDAESHSRRVDDEIAQGLASLYLCAAEKEAQQLGFDDLAISDETEIAERARRASTVLASTHRLPQAARGLQIAAQCELVIADQAEDGAVESTSNMQAMKDLTEAISILSNSGDLDWTVCERLIESLHESVAASVPRWRF